MKDFEENLGISVFAGSRKSNLELERLESPEHIPSPFGEEKTPKAKNSGLDSDNTVQNTEENIMDEIDNHLKENEVSPTAFEIGDDDDEV